MKKKKLLYSGIIIKDRAKKEKKESNLHHNSCIAYTRICKEVKINVFLLKYRRSVVFAAEIRIIV